MVTESLRRRPDSPSQPFSRSVGDHLGDGTLTWDDATPHGVLAFRRTPGFRCIVNLSRHGVQLDPDCEFLLTSVPQHGRLLLPDTAAWVAE